MGRSMWGAWRQGMGQAWGLGVPAEDEWSVRQSVGVKAFKSSGSFLCICLSSNHYALTDTICAPLHAPDAAARLGQGTHTGGDWKLTLAPPASSAFATAISPLNAAVCRGDMPLASSTSAQTSTGRL